MEIQIETGSQNDTEDRAYVLEQLKAYNATHAKQEFTRKRIHLYARDTQGKVVGGCFVSLTFHTLVIDIMWVADDMRGNGTGRKMLEKAFEIARETGAVWSTVETTSFQARPFYEKMGYEVFAELEDSPIGHTCYWLKKRLQ